MNDGTIHSMIDVLQTVFDDLQVEISLHTLERLAMTIHKGMSGPARNFHTPEHIFDMLHPSDPLRCLAALFHDIVYYQVDKGFSPEICEMLSPYIYESDGEIVLYEDIPANDRIQRLTVVLVLGKLPLRPALEKLPLLLRHPAPLDKLVGKRLGLVTCPGATCGRELPEINQIVFKCQNGE